MNDTNCGRGMYHDYPEEKQIERLEKKLGEAKAWNKLTEMEINNLRELYHAAESELATLRATREQDHGAAIEAADTPGDGWTILKEGEPLQAGDGFLDPSLKLWVDYACRPDIFRGVGCEGSWYFVPKNDTAHTWPWRRRATVTNSQQKGGDEPCPAPAPTTMTPAIPIAQSIGTSNAAPTSDPEGAATYNPEKAFAHLLELGKSPTVTEAAKEIVEEVHKGTFKVAIRLRVERVLSRLIGNAEAELAKRDELQSTINDWIERFVSLRSQLESSQAECERLRAILEETAQIFDRYKELHANKTPPALEKANANAEIAAHIRAAMQPASAPGKEETI